MNMSERTVLLNNTREPSRNNGLSLFFVIVCIVDVFGVFPIITLPKVIIDCGFYGILVVLVVCFTQTYTAILLGRCWIIANEIYPVMDNKNRYPYSALVEITYGRCLSKCVTFLLDLTIFGGGIPNLIVGTFLASRTLQLLSQRISDHNVDISYCYWIIILGITLCPILWLGSPKDMKCVCTLSVLIVTTVFILIISCLLSSEGTESVNQDKNFIMDVPFWKSMITAYGIIAFQFDIHPTILTIQIDMINKLKLPTAIISAFIISLCMFGLTTILFSIKYGMATRSSVLETLPETMPLDITAGLTALQLCLTSAVSNNALYQHMEDCLSISRNFNIKRCVLRTILMLLAIVLAQSVPRFDLVMSSIGGTLMGPLVFIFPPVIYLKMLSLKNNHERLAMQYTDEVFNTNTRNLSKYREHKFKEDFSISVTSAEIFSKRIISKHWEKVGCLLIIILSTTATVFITYLNISDAILSYSNYTKPCIYNISSVILYHLY